MTFQDNERYPGEVNAHLTLQCLEIGQDIFKTAAWSTAGGKEVGN